MAENLLDDPRCNNRGVHGPHEHKITWNPGRSRERVETYQCPGNGIRLEVVRRKICPNFGEVCLEGGCGYCQFHGTWLKITTIERRVRKTKNLKLLSSFIYGVRREFCNAPIEYNDGSRKRPYRAASIS